MSSPDQSRQTRPLKILALIALLVIAYFAGVITERMRFDQERSAVIKKYEKALSDWRHQQMQAEKQNSK
jgi:hypothetical protein